MFGLASPTEIHAADFPPPGPAAAPQEMAPGNSTGRDAVTFVTQRLTGSAFRQAPRSQ